MARIIAKRGYLVAVLISILTVLSIGFSIRSLYAEYDALSATEVIAFGKTQLFQKSISGTKEAYQTFQKAYSNNYGTAEAQDKIKIRVYLAVTRIMDLVVRNDGGSIDTLAELLAQYGITSTGDAFDTMIINPPPMNNDEKIILPATTPPSTENMRAFLAGPFLTAVNASIADMDAAIALCPASEGIDREIIAKELIDATDPTQLDVEMDAGDYYLFRAMLKFMKAYSLICAGYNHDIDIREFIALLNLEAGQEMFKRLLDRYPNFLKISDNAKLNEARLTLIDAITDYETASVKIRDDVLTASGAEEFISLDREDEDYYDESIFRENLGKIKTSLQNNAPILLTEDRFGTVYSVYGGNSFTTDEISWWEKGLHPLQYGYTLLGESSSTATFNFNGGQYAYYIITTRPGNIAAVDSVQCSGATLSIHATGNTINWANNIINATDGNYALLGGEWDGEGAFIVMQPSATINSLSVNLTNIPADSPIRLQLGEDRINFFPFFGNGTNAKALRDMFPQLNQYGYAVPWTMGHGLVNDATLGGILPDYTQNQWTIDEDWFFQQSGPVTITDRSTINVQDSAIDDWSGINPAFTDIPDDISDPARDIQYLYLVKDSTYLYLRIDTAGTISIPGTYDWRAYDVSLRKLPGDQEEMPGDRSIRVYYDSYNSQWRAQLFTVNSLGYMSLVANLNSTDFKVFEKYIEMKVLLSQLGTLSGRFIGVSAEGSWDRGDENETCLQIQPVASVTGSLTVPDYDGVGPVRIGVFKYGPDFSTDPQKRLGALAVYPVSGSLPGTYTINGLPVGEKVFLSVFWDRDGNGVVSPGDYTNFYQPFTTIDGTYSLNLTASASDAHSGYPAPEFSFVSVFNEKLSEGNWNVRIAASLTGPSPEDVTVTVSGQGFEYTLTPGAWIGNRLGLIYKINVPGLPNGDYTFTAVDSLGRKTERIYHYEARYDLPNITSLAPANQFYTGTTTPTLSWTPPAGGPYAYQVWIIDYNNSNNVWYASDLISVTSLTVPSGVLLPNAPYYWFVRLYDSADHPMNFTMSPINAFYSGTYITAPAIQPLENFPNVGISSSPPTGAITTYSNNLEFKLPGVAPWDITASHIYKGGSWIYSGGAPYFFNRTDNSWLTISVPSSTPIPDGNDYELRLDIIRPTSTISRTGISYNFQNIEAVNLTSLTPTNNYYFKTSTPSFSWTGVTDTLNRLRIYDPLGKIPVYSAPWNYTPSATVPAGILKPGGTYLWTVMTLKYTTDSTYVYAYTNSEGNTSNRALFRFTLQPPLRGDVSGNGDIGLEDAVLALQVTAGLSPAMALSTGGVNADVDSDGRVGLPEALYIIQTLSDLR